MNAKPLTAKHYRILRTLYGKQDRGLARPLYGMNPDAVPAAIEAWKDLQPDRESRQPRPPETPMGPERYQAAVAFLRGPKPPPTTRHERDVMVRQHWGDNLPPFAARTLLRPPSLPDETPP